MINSLTVENFQSHEESSLVLSPGVNCIVGSSDSGKSALLRALNWIANNRPSGEAFCSSWGGTTAASVELSDGVIISRLRNSKENVYWLGDKSLKAVGKDVPEEIKEALQITSINLQYQMDAPFLLSETPGEIARFLNQTVNLDVIHSSMKRVESIKRNASQRAEAAERNKEKFQKALEGVSESVKALEPLITEGEELETKIAGTKNFVSGLEKLTSSIEFNDEKISEAPNYDDAERILIELSTSAEVIRRFEKSREGLQTLVSQLERIERDSKQLSRIDEAGELFRSLKEQNDGLTEREKHQEQLEVLADAIVEKDSQIKSTAEWVKKSEDEFADVFPDVCPLCGQEVIADGQT